MEVSLALIPYALSTKHLWIHTVRLGYRLQHVTHRPSKRAIRHDYPSSDALKCCATAGAKIPGPTQGPTHFSGPRLARKSPTLKWGAKGRNYSVQGLRRLNLAFWVSTTTRRWRTLTFPGMLMIDVLLPIFLRERAPMAGGNTLPPLQENRKACGFD